MSFLRKIKNSVLSSAEDLVAGVTKFQNKKFMEGTVAVCAVVSIASNGASSQEKQKMLGFIQQSKELAVFDVNDVITFFNKLVDGFAFDPDIGKGEAMKYIVQLKEKPEAAQLALRVGIAVAKSDGDFDAQEKEAAREICVALGFNPADYQL
ncbi:tellurite resistance TerB family protein [Vibrio owensii]|uniref:tellurite resistance TerB family protein n=1 Tax=Vibrio owensii TaxID=696485 RepID=UPI0005F07221|nr:tellurite resistance TerB family protein [Vibrio owensii]